MIPKKEYLHRYGVFRLLYRWIKNLVFEALTGKCRTAYVASLNLNMCSSLTTFQGALNFGADELTAVLFTTGLGLSLFFMSTVVAAGRCSPLRLLVIWPIVVSFSVYTNALGLSGKFTVEFNEQRLTQAAETMFHENMEIIRRYAQQALDWAAERHDRGRLNDDYEPTKKRWLDLQKQLPLLPPTDDREETIRVIQDQFGRVAKATAETWHTFVIGHPVPIPVITDPPPVERERAVFAQAWEGSLPARAILVVSVLIDGIPLMLMLLTRRKRTLAQRIALARRKIRDLDCALWDPLTRDRRRMRKEPRQAETVRDFKVVGDKQKRRKA